METTVPLLLLLAIAEFFPASAEGAIKGKMPKRLWSITLHSFLVGRRKTVLLNSGRGKPLSDFNRHLPAAAVAYFNLSLFKVGITKQRSFFM